MKSICCTLYSAVYGIHIHTVQNTHMTSLANQIPVSHLKLLSFTSLHSIFNVYGTLYIFISMRKHKKHITVCGNDNNEIEWHKHARNFFVDMNKIRWQNNRLRVFRWDVQCTLYSVVQSVYIHAKWMGKNRSIYTYLIIYTSSIERKRAKKSKPMNSFDGFQYGIS